MKAMILAAGYGTRLRPLTLERAKPAIPLLGTPLVVRLIHKLLKVGASQFRLNLHHLPDTIESIFRNEPYDNLPISFSYEDEILGTAGGLKNNESFFDDDVFLMVNGDIAMDFDLERALAFHREQEAFATMILFPQTSPYRYYPVRIDEQRRLCNFKETGSGGTPTDEVYVFTGAHILDPEIFDFIPSGRFYEINSEVYPAAIKAGKTIYGFPVDGYWNDLGDPQRYLEAQRDIFNKELINPPISISDNVHIEQGTQIGPYVSIEPGCVIESESTIQDTIMWDNSTIMGGSSVLNCIVGAHMTVKGDQQNMIITKNGEARIE